MKKNNTWIVSLVVFIIWIVVVLGGEMLSVGGDPTGLDRMVQAQIVPALVAGPIFLLIVVAYFKWKQETGLKWVENTRSLRFAWLPALAIILMLVIGLPSNQLGGKVLLIVLINSLLVGISEELMFRGILLHGAKTRYSLWVAIMITSVLFGLVHSLNGFLTGDFVPAIFQAIMAFFSGFMFMGLRMRQNSLIPAMLMHGLWDFSVFAGTASTLSAVGMVFPFIFFGYGYWLMKDYRHGKTAEG